MVTLTDAWEEYTLEKSIVLCPTSISCDYNQVKTWLEKCPIQDLSQGRKILIWILTQEPKKSARRVAMYLKTLYKWASSEEVDLISKNTIANFRLPKMSQVEDVVVIRRDEQATVLASLEKKRKNHQNWRNYAEFMLQTGMRTGEVRALQWKNIRNNTILVHSNFTITHGYKDSTKTNRSRWVPLNQRALNVLKQTPEVNDFIFPWCRESFQSFFYYRMKELYDGGVISYLYRPYDLRHTAISRWLESGIPVAQVAQWAGNSNEIIWKHYLGNTQDYEIPIL